MFHWFSKNTVWPEPIWIKVNSSWILLPQHQSTCPRGSESASISDPNLVSKSTSECEHCKTRFTSKNRFWKVYEMMQILGLLGVYFDAVVVEVKKNLLLFRLAVTILCCAASFVQIFLNPTNFLRYRRKLMVQTQNI